jgi:poly(3-hydroxybutyrate) depolymerase
MRRLLLAASAAVLIGAPTTTAEKTLKESLTSGGIARTYYLFVPETAAAGPAPLLLLLHGSGRNGMSLVERWDALAKKQGIILAAPDSLDRSAWQIPADGPDFIHDVVEAVRGKQAVDPHRIYLFGHSAGAGQGLCMALLESEYFAAAAVHAGGLNESDYAYVDLARRKIPLALWIGRNDAVVPLRFVRDTRAFLDKRGFGVELREIAGHTHNYYSRADDINREAWDFLRAHALEQDPKYQQYRLGR